MFDLGVFMVYYYKERVLKQNDKCNMFSYTSKSFLFYIESTF
jgi:hypothetical protein